MVMFGLVLTAILRSLKIYEKIKMDKEQKEFMKNFEIKDLEEENNG